ncbi:Glycerophosphocholine phosphodiesterase [Balamuthia mandrillaris]
MSINQLTVEQFKEIGISVMRGKSKNIIKNQPRTLRDMPTKNGAEGNGDKKKQDSLQQQLQQLESQQQSGQPTNASSAENQHQKSKKKMSKEHKAQLLERRRSFGDVVDKQFLKELEEEERLEEERMRAEKKASKTPPQIREEEASTQQQEDDFEKIKVPVLEECEISVEKAKARAREKVKKQRSHVTFTVPHPQVQDTFATLEEVFSLVPKHTGLNIEVKYPTEEEIADGVYYYERNKTVDAILKVVFDFAHEQRRIVWSSFDPDICIMLSLKQPRYPVLFLTAAGTQVLLDQRMNSLQQAVRFAKSVNLLGIVSKVTPLLMSPSLIKIIKSSGLLLATYGADNNEEENRKLQEKWGVDFIISDHANPVQRKLVLAAPSQPSSDPLLSVPVLPSH